MYPYQLPKLSYGYEALEPHIDKQTMRLHHTKHHQAYVDKLNAALEGQQDLQNYGVEDLLGNINRVPEKIRQAVINHGGGHANHSLFWTVMGPEGGGEPAGEVAKAINNTFGSFADFKEKFTDTALGIFGSGWAWLCAGSGGNLTVASSPNQDSPLMNGYIPILGLDVWEHAYYLKYQNRRPDYIAAWWNVIDWNEVNRRYKQAQQ